MAAENPSGFVKLASDIAHVAEYLMNEAKVSIIETALQNSDVARVFLGDVSVQGFLALCELQTAHPDDDSLRVTQVEVTARLSQFMDKRVSSCVVITKKSQVVATSAGGATIKEDLGTAEELQIPSSDATAPSAVASITSVKELHFQTIALATPFEDLQTSLSTIFEPLLQQRDTAIRNGIQDLVTAIKSKDNVMVDFKVHRYVHAELLALCAANPEADVNHLFEKLGAKSTDRNFINDVRLVYNRLNLNLDLDVREASSFREEKQYWESMLAWLKDVSQEFQSKEWKLVKQVLSRNVGISIDQHVAAKVNVVNEYIGLLTSLNSLYDDLQRASTVPKLIEAANAICGAVSTLKKYPAHRMVVLVESFVVEVADRVLELAAKKNLFAMKLTEEALPFLRDTRAAFIGLKRMMAQTVDVLSKVRSETTRAIQDAAEREENTKKFNKAKARVAHQTRINEASERANLLRKFLEEHFQFYDVLKSIFSTGEYKRFVEALELCHTDFALAVSGLLWDLSAQGNNAFAHAVQHYDKCVLHLEEEVALLVKSMLSSSPNSVEMYRVHSQFHPIKRPKIRAVINQFQAPLLEMIAQGMEEAKERYLQDSAQVTIRTWIASGLSPLAAHILWEKSIELSMTQMLVKRDAISSYGWHELIGLQTLERRWILNEELAQHLNTPVDELKKKMRDNELKRLNEGMTRRSHEDPEVDGTAIMLAYLEEFYIDYQDEWEKEIGVKMAKDFLRKCYPEALDDGRMLVKSLDHVVQNQRTDRDFVVERRNVTARIEEKVSKWCQEVQKHMSHLGVSAEAPIIQKCVYTTKHNKTQLDVTIPAELDTLLNDMKRLSALKLLGHRESKNPLDLRAEAAFLAANESRISLANILREVLDTFNAIMISDDGTIPLLLAEEYGAVHEKIIRPQTIQIQWDAELELRKHIKELAEAVAQLSLAVDKIRALILSVEDQIDKLSEDQCSPREIRNRVTEIRSCVNAITIKSTNATHWVKSIHPKLEKALVHQLERFIEDWAKHFRSMADDNRFLHEDVETEKYNLKPLRIRMKVVRRKIQLETVAAEWRAHWYGELNKALSWLNDIPSLDSSLLMTDFGSNSVTSYNSTYHRLIDLVPRDILRQPMDAIESCIEQAIAAESEWQRSQQFLNLDVSLVEQKLGNSLEQWMAALQYIKTFSENEMEGTRLLGGIVILSDDARREINSKLKNMNVSLNISFAKTVEQQFLAVYNAVIAMRSSVESMKVQQDPRDALRFLCEFPGIKAFLVEKEGLMSVFQSAEAYLKRQNFDFSSEWLYCNRVKDEFRICKESVERKNVAVQGARTTLAATVKDSVSRLEYNIGELDRKFRAADLDNTKRTPPQALQELSLYSNDAAKIKEEVDRTVAAQQALGEDVMGTDKLLAVISDLKGLKLAWDHALQIHEDLSRMGQRSFFEIAPRTIQSELMALEQKMAQFPDSIRSYQSYRDAQAKIRRLLTYHKILQDLRSDAMIPLDRAERHWVALKSQLKQPWVLPELTLQDFWNSNPTAHIKVFNAVIEVAQGERRLENQLQHIASFWMQHTLDITFYQNKVALVKGWDALFERLGEDLNSLTAMKLSPFYKAQQIASVASDWDRKLNGIRQVLEVLLDVQRRWVYLDGIFSGSQEIRQQLPNEASQFDRTSREFIGMMPKSKQGPLTAVKFVEDDRMQSNLEKIASQLTLIQRTLGEYLDTQRSRFPRFYFVGDEDLLEVIGSGKDPVLVAKHLKKMFCGVSGVVMKTGSATVVEGVSSPEGEVVTLAKAVDANGQAVYEWLYQLQLSTSQSLQTSVATAVSSYISSGTSSVAEWMTKFPSQVVTLAAQIGWVSSMESVLGSSSSLKSVEASMATLLDQLAKDVLQPTLSHSQRHKAEQLITVAVYQRDTSRTLFTKGVTSKTDFDWLCRMRPSIDSKTEKVTCSMADAQFEYSYEYLGMQERLVQTALTDKCFLTLTQALHTRLGGSPSGPAGTGKTETVKALGMQLGRFVLVFNCDETFDFKSMGRIFVGLCQVGSWGCFDEFNRLEERILSAVSQQIQSIQDGLRLNSTDVTLDGKKVAVHGNTGIFITMNPGYAGRSNLPDNLKQLFRSVAMISPDRENIAEVMLFAQGFKTAESLSRKVVPLFRLCKDQLSQQSHYDFGLRALKSVLVSAGGLKRSAVARGEVDLTADDEMRLLMQSLTETIVPKLVADDVTLFYPLLADVFPGLAPVEEPLESLKAALEKHSAQHGYTPSPLWVSKMVQLYKILHVNHGIMLVGSSGCGKTAAWMTLLRALADIEDVDGHAYVLDPKAISKGELYGVLDPTTREWRDGVFTATLRRIVDNVKGDDQRKKRHWIIFDGDVDPEWVENLNSLLDDNKLFTLPNGERLTLPSNVRIMFEVQDLRFATPATVSRCGMVWFSADTITTRLLMDRFVSEAKRRPFTAKEDPPVTFAERSSLADARKEKRRDEGNDQREFSLEEEQLVDIQSRMISCVEDMLGPGGMVEQSLQLYESAFSSFSIMEFDRAQSVRSMFTLFSQSAILIAQHQDQGCEMSPSVVRLFAQRRLAYAVLWGFGSQLPITKRAEYARELKIADPPPEGLLEYAVDLDGNWAEWRKKVVKTDIHPDKVGTNDVVIPTVDTTRHEEVISSWLRTGKPVILCGPPGSGKTMSLTAVLRASTQYEAVFLNFSSATVPETILKTLEQYCSVKNTQFGLTMVPSSGKKLIVFCDEINLPSPDKYGTQRVVQFMRQLTERQGFYRAKDNVWIRLDGVQFVGACNPPTDPGRVPLTHRFLRWAPVLFVDFPSFESLQAIYETYCRAMFHKNVRLRAIAPNLARAMVDFYKNSQEHFTPEMQRHYVYSPRELSRWSRAIYEGILTLDDAQQKSISIEEMVRLAVHEGLRIFRDRLVTEDEGQWTDDVIDRSFLDAFNGLSTSALVRPILFSTVFTRAYASVEREELRTKIRERLREFREEEVDVELVVFDAVIDHVIRIDRVLRQPLGHMLLVGSSGVGKTVLSRFVAWLNHLSVFQVKAHRGYNLADFEEDLRTVMRRAGCKREKICFIFDESNIMDSNFLEYMNALLASGEVPGLFEGEAWAKLMQAIREGVSSSGSGDYVDTSSEQDLYKWFIRNVQQYLHVVFTMNPSSPDFHNRSATSPALFNRCTIDWFGDWSSETTFHVAKELSARVDVMFACSHKFENADEAQHALADCINRIHDAIQQINVTARAKNANVGTFVTPRHFLDFIKHFHILFKEKRSAVEDLQRHLNSGLAKLKETSLIVDDQQRSLEEKEKILAESGRRAQEMLERIITETDKAKKGKADATTLKATLEVESANISEQRQTVEVQLAQAEPALKDAEAALNTIDPKDLRELRAYATPPPMVKKVLEAVVTVMGEKRGGDWEVIKTHITNKDFITQIKAFRPSNITDETREKVKRQFLSDAAFSYENAQRASKAVGPLQKWVAAQVNFSDIFASVGPLRAKIDRLAEEYEAKLRGLQQAEKDIASNEASIARLKETYQITTEENSKIKMEINLVASRCNRAKALMGNLLAEKLRWEDQSASFQQQTRCVMGDCLLAAAFLAYIGYYDELYRRDHIIPEWQDIVDACGIDFRREMSIVEYLSRPEQRLEWSSNKLPQDTLCIENAIIIERFNRYPLIIDPSGQAVQYLLGQLSGKKITKTSFVEKGFMKQLENAVRFGYPILVQDVEHIDPVLNPLLNQEVRRVGGRQLVRLGAQDVDISPSFMLYLSTRDSTFQFAPDVCGRVTMVNFTVTLSSLQSQCLHHVMLHERPDVDERRSDLMKLQGEYKARLRTLEQDLLTAISVSEGNILENEQLIKTLETLKKESTDIQQKFNQSEAAFEDIRLVEVKYTPLARSASKMYFSLGSLRELDEMYLFSLKFFLDILEVSLENLPETPNKDDHIPIIARQMFVTAHRRVTRATFQKDHLAIGLRLAQLRSTIPDDVGRQISKAEWDMLLAASPLVTTSPGDISLAGLPKGLTASQLNGIQVLSNATAFDSVVRSMSNAANLDSWGQFFAPSTANPLSFIPSDALPDFASQARKAFLVTILTKLLRKDAFTGAADQLLRKLFDIDAKGTSYTGKTFFQDSALSLADVLPELANNTPLLLVSAAGYDASGRVEELAKACNTNLSTVAMGSPEGYEEAEVYLSRCMRQGGWVLLKNVHLASKFLSVLEKRLHGEHLESRINANFQLFLSSERSAKIPAGLITASVVVVLEPPPGVKANLIRTIGAMHESKIPQYPKELPRLYFAAAWLHAVITERMNYIPLGWTKRYEFSEAEFRRCITTIDSWVQRIRGERHNVTPSELPWRAIRQLVCETIYGGKVDSEFDDALLGTFCTSVLHERMYQSSDLLVEGDSSMRLENIGHTLKEMQDWIHKLPDQQPPQWLGLPASATSMVLNQRATYALDGLIKIQSIFDDDEEFVEGSQNKSFAKASQGRAANTAAGSAGGHHMASRWATRLSAKVVEWKSLIDAAPKLQQPSSGKKVGDHPIVMALTREAQCGEALRKTVLADLADLVQLCSGALKPTNHHRRLIDSLLKEQVPLSWKRYTVLPGMSASTWIADFCKRLAHICSLRCAEQSPPSQPISLGLLFFPEALLTASRQCAARSTKRPLERLVLSVELFDIFAGGTSPSIDEELSIVGVSIQSGVVRGNRCHAVEGSNASNSSMIVPLIKLKWIHHSGEDAKGGISEAGVRIPLYLNSSRADALAVFPVDVDPSVPSHVWLQKGLCLIAWNGEQ